MSVFAYGGSQASLAVKNAGFHAVFFQRGNTASPPPQFAQAILEIEKTVDVSAGRGRDEDREKIMTGSEKQGSMHTCLYRTTTGSSDNGDGRRT